MNRILTKICMLILGVMVMIPNVVFATEMKTALHDLAQDVADVAQPVGAFFILMSVLMVGFNIIKNRDKAEDRTKAMESLMWLGIGAFIIGMVLTVGPAIGNLVGTGADLGTFTTN